ncbi:glucose-1-phosphate thymidylyltransferase RfbA [Cohnella thailandensis]|uniref:Glucose-1-phosphate thymidylyltransferase n=1 Tax=Cohnella thailandensis TaxID=557557 RepID=A0A841SRP2_9BACL|nr:glucose-1-phosphate thymidylyltransferase RfbA [Cohnella thailandensis]MBB6632570.1 glucose-1-phosphate thymidylyltransferase RfbA [Cohnella thailandensis]MBP1971864.1 glucose-1-phosphate thymidylyltransferase [Cohnella thailandensis]
MKGIILAGGKGTRLFPLTKVITKQLLPVYDKPMIYYPLSVLMLAGIKDILIISTPYDQHFFQQLFGDGSPLGLNISYAVQPSPDGLAQAFLIGQHFIGKDSVALILGDNLYYGTGFPQLLHQVKSRTEGATLFGYRVNDPSRFGVVEFDKDRKVISLEEKPLYPKSDYAVTGLYFYDNNVIEIAKSVRPSVRGEYEIHDVNVAYLNQNKLYLELLGRGFAWMDMGTHDSLIQTAHFIEMMEKRQGLKIACLEEIAYRMNYIDEQTLMKHSRELNNDYGRYLKDIILAKDERTANNG